MKIQPSCSNLLALYACFHFPKVVYGSGDSGSGSGDDPWNYYGGDDNFYSFTQYGDSEMHWSDYALNPEACMSR